MKPPKQPDYLTQIQKYRKKYETELLQSVIPFWEEHCIDPTYGGFFTALDQDGSIYDTSKWMWMQWRIVYEFAILYKTPYGTEKWLQIAESGYKFLTTYGKDPESGNYYFGLNQQGTPIVAPYNIYSECFAMMGSAALYKATGKKEYQQEALHAMNNYISRIENPKGRWNKQLSGAPHRLNFGHYMILANLGAVMRECLNNTQYDAQIEECISILVKHFYNSQYQVFFENINQDYSFDLDSCEGRHINPGHGLEGCWFILDYAEKHNRSDLIQQVSEIVKNQLRFGWDQEHGGIYYFMDVLGKPHSALEWNMKLWWVHNEALIACLYAYRLTKDPEFWTWFQKIDAWTWTHFPDPQNGEWFGYLNRQGEPTHLLKGGKWKTFFHLPRCLLTCINQLDLL